MHGLEKNVDIGLETSGGSSQKYPEGKAVETTHSGCVKNWSRVHYQELPHQRGCLSTKPVLATLKYNFPGEARILGPLNN